MLLDLQGYTRLLIESVGLQTSVQIFVTLKTIGKGLKTQICFEAYERLIQAFEKELEIQRREKNETDNNA